MAACVVVVVMAAVGCGRLGNGTTTSSGGASTSVPAAVSGAGAAPGTTTGSASGATVKVAVTPTGHTSDEEITTPDGRTRTYHVYVPGALPTGPVPLLVALHGGTGWGTQFEQNSGFDGLAEANGFIVVYPDGIGAALLPNNRVWNGGDCCGAAEADKQNVDDVGFISTVIDKVEASDDIDRHRVFAAGHSNGAIMSYRLACELADKIVAIGVQAGALEVQPCHPALPVAAIEIHGTADQNIPIDGGKGAHSISRTDFHAPKDALTTLAAADHCPTDPQQVADTGNPDVTVTTWSPCATGTTVQWVVVSGANHAWMGHPGATGLTEKIIGEPYARLDSSLVIWTFLGAHPRP